MMLKREKACLDLDLTVLRSVVDATVAPLAPALTKALVVMLLKYEKSCLDLDLTML
jgi:hypothetical protein